MFQGDQDEPDKASVSDYEFQNEISINQKIYESTDDLIL
jgi:hypothetical protein